MSVHCAKCCTSRTGDEIGQPCRSEGCDGIIERQPEFSELVDRLPESMTCGRRGEISDPNGVFKILEGPDHWDKFKSNGNRVCSYCGSLHPEDFLRLVKESATAPEDALFRSVVEVEPSDKSYKIYVHQPGVRNAHEGGIKFYTHHLERDDAGKVLVTEQQEAEYKEAVRRSDVRFEQVLYGKSE